jgi:MoxR-like ATPase
MEERHVTVDGTTHPLPDPFFLVATQNPFEHAGTFPLVEGQRDRFAIVVEMGHPGHSTERDLLLGSGGVESLDRLQPVVSPEELRLTIAAVRALHCDPSVADYIVNLAEASRAHADIRVGASPRASIGLLHAARAHAVIAGHDFVSPDDVKAVAVAALAHRLILSGGPDLALGGAVVRAILERTPVPRG